MRPLFFLAIMSLSLLPDSACRGCADSPFSPFRCEAPIMEQETEHIEKQKGGEVHMIVLSTKDRKQIVLNQTSNEHYYIVAKLIQTGIASLDLILEPEATPTHYQARVAPGALQKFQLGPAEIELTTPDGTLYKPITLY